MSARASVSLAERIVRLAGVLRAAGVAVGTAETLVASRAAETVGVACASDLACALAATLLRRHEDRVVFDAAFAAVFLAPPQAAEAAAALPASRTRPPTQRRLAAALAADAAPNPAPPEREVGVLEALAASDVESLRHRDFEQLSAEEARAAQQLLLAAARWWRRPLRRWRPVRRGLIDIRRTLREHARRPDAALPAWRSRRDAPLRLVLVCDVSGSMRAYARAFLQLAHALAGRDRSVELFTFATRLTRVTGLLREPNSDRCLARIGAAVADWDSGTRIGSALARLHRDYRRQALGAHAVVVLLTDGLERGDPGELQAAAARIKRSCHSVLWLNPLLRYADYQPLARGAAALADTLPPARPAHDPASLVTLARSLAELAAGAAR